MFCRFAEGVITFKIRTNGTSKFWFDGVEFWVESETNYDSLDAIGKGARLAIGENKYTLSKQLRDVIFTNDSRKFNGESFVSLSGFETLVLDELLGKLDKWNRLNTSTIKR